jgi:Helix-turn-helix
VAINLYRRHGSIVKQAARKTFAQRLFALRTARGLTQVDLAKALGTTQRVVSYYETKESCLRQIFSLPWFAPWEPLPMNCLGSNLPESARTTHQSSGDCGRDFSAWSHYRKKISARSFA